jgi:nucleoid-associated protein YgaU
MGLEKLAITTYSNPKFSAKVRSITVSINPDQYEHNYAISYTNSSGQGANGQALRFNAYGAETVSFTIWFDGTGAIPGAPASETTSIETQITKFRDTVFPYDGKVHSPNYLELRWGTLLFKCVLVTLNFTYTMFAPSGAPIRAKCTASFRRYVTPDDLAKMANNSSPDMTHLVTVKAGDTLPLLCHQVYGSSTHYPNVARVNGLVGFRALTPGTQLLFPPVKAEAARPGGGQPARLREGKP